MKRTWVICSLLSLIFFGYADIVHAQPVISSDYIPRLVEKTSLITDREIYCVDEQILFSAFNLSSEQLRKADWSNVLYVELISPDGQVIAKRKCKYNMNGASGMLQIPMSTLTGNYYLRAYTRWMRDFSPYNYFYKLITVINPYRSELLEPSTNTVSEKPEEERELTNNSNLVLQPDHDNYGKREQVNLRIQFNTGSLNGKWTVSVIPAGIKTSLSADIKGLQELTFSPDFIPETRGLSISGKVVNEVDSIPIPYTLVGLTVFKEKPEIRNIRTNDKGQFFFSFFYLDGEYETFISAKAEGNKNPLILVDNDFSTSRIELPYVPVNISQESKNYYQSLAFTSQIQTLYRQQKVKDELRPFTPDSSFYGVPDFVLNLSDYIALPNIKDYFYELVPPVKVKHEGEKVELSVLGAYSDLSIYKPMVLVDMVPIFDIDKILALQPEKIDRIEVITLPYVRGDIVFGGIVSLFSKVGDLAGIELPTAGRFITYSMLGSDSLPINPFPIKSHIPDLRNCLYWNPSVKPDQYGTAKLSFNTSDNTGEFLIILMGVDENGNVQMTRSQITVK